MKSIFRAYDIRGIVDEHLTEELMFKIGFVFARMSKVNKIVVGRDGRLSSERLSSALVSGLAKGNMTIYDVGLVPTPVLYFAISYLGTVNGMMITGSHNPVNYNGVKIVQDYKAFFEEKIDSLYNEIILLPDNFTYGRGSQSKTIKMDVVDSYVQRIVSEYKNSNIELDTAIPIAVDPANGATSTIATSLYSELGCKVYAINDEVDGTFPSHHPDPSQPDNLIELQNLTKANSAVVGLAFDGDGDRLGVIDGNGRIIMLDDILCLYSEDVLLRFPNSTIVYDVKCGPILPNKIKSLGGDPVISRTGHSYIKNMIVSKNARLGGEMSGHIFFNDYWYGFDDGVYSGFRLLKILLQTGNRNKLLDIPQRFCTHEIKLDFFEGEQIHFMENFIKKMKWPNSGDICMIDGVRIEYPFGWGLIRASNTTPSVVMRFEGNDAHSLDRVKNIFKEQLHTTDPHLTLDF